MWIRSKVISHSQVRIVANVRLISLTIGYFQYKTELVTSSQHGTFDRLGAV